MSTEEAASRQNATFAILSEPGNSIDAFNAGYKAWMTSLQKQMPQLHSDFDQILDRLYVADAREPNYPMHVFQWYTGPYIQIMLAKDARFFDEIARDSKGKSMPIAFKDAFVQLDAQSQMRAWKTLEFLMRLTANVYSKTYVLQSS